MKVATETDIRNFIGLSVLGVEYSTNRKNQYHRYAKKICALIAQKLGLPEDSYDIRSNMGGLAVSGEVTLHHEKIYIQFSLSCLQSLRDKVMWRKCHGRRDYCGETNHWFTLSELKNLDMLCEKFQSVLNN